MIRDTKRNCLYEFGPFRLDTIQATLSRHGVPVPLRPKAFDVLLLLILNRDRIVSRDELIETIWKLHVSDGVLRFQINQLRKLLGDDAHDPQYIQTYPKRGFRFIANVSEMPVQDSEPAEPDTKDIGAIHAATGPTEQSDVQDIRPMPEGDTRQPAMSGTSAKLTLPFGGHLRFVIIVCALYASLYAIELIVEIAYEFDRYGRVALQASPLVFSWVFFTSLGGLAVSSKRIAQGKRGLVFSSLIFVTAVAVLFGGICMFLPAVPVTQLNFQAYTAQAAYLKTMCYFVVAAVLFLLLPFHFILAAQRELQTGQHEFVQNLLIDNRRSVLPAGMVYPRLGTLLLLLAVMMTLALLLNHNLLSNLRPARFMNLFSILIYVRSTLYFVLAIQCVAWYYETLSDLRRKSFCLNDAS